MNIQLNSEKKGEGWLENIREVIQIVRIKLKTRGGS